MSTLKLTIAFMAVALLAGCSRATINLFTGEVEVTAKLKKVTHNEQGDIVWGNLSIEGERMLLVSADIDCFVLHIGKSVSTAIIVGPRVSGYTQSPVHYSARNGEIDVGVQWRMKDFANGTNADLEHAKLIVTQTRVDACFQLQGRY